MPTCSCTSPTTEIDMTQIAPLTIDTADAATAATLKAVKAKLGSAGGEASTEVDDAELDSLLDGNPGSSAS